MPSLARRVAAWWSPPAGTPARDGGDPGGWAQLLCADPLVLHVFPSHLLTVGAMSVLGAELKDQNVHVLMTPVWTFEDDSVRPLHLAAFRAYAQSHARHRLYFLANTDREAELMSEAGVWSIVASHNCLVDEDLFQPLPTVEPAYDAISNARLSAYKRLDLACEVESLALVYYFVTGEDTVAGFHGEHARLAALMPTARFVNDLTPTGCTYISPQHVNEWMARSRVGLCLSAVEGAMRASVEYLFAGLSVVSTPSLGGRDRYFDDEFCIVAEADPRSIRDAVAALVARGVPRDHVRSRTLAKVEADRKRYIDCVQDIIDRDRGRMRFEPEFRRLVHGSGIMRWRSMAELSTTIRQALVNARTVSPG